MRKGDLFEAAYESLLLTEIRSQPSLGFDLWIDPNEVLMFSGLDEATRMPYAAGEKSPIGRDLYRDLGEFRPSEKSHAAITHELPDYLARRGFVTASPQQIQVLSPLEQSFKRDFRVFRSKITGAPADLSYLRPHHDGRPRTPEDDERDASRNTPFGSKVHMYNAMWSTAHPTKVFDAHGNSGKATGDETPIKAASKAYHPVIINDRDTFHAASGHDDRWFARTNGVQRLNWKVGVPMYRSNGTLAGVTHDPGRLHDVLYNRPEHQSRELRGLVNMYRNGDRDTRKAIDQFASGKYEPFHPRNQVSTRTHIE